jgi:hypothetical protein
MNQLILTRATRRNIPEDAILHSRLRENLKSYQCIPIQLQDGKPEKTILIGSQISRLQ